MAKGIPLMGRDPDGEAKIINVDENGNLKVSQSGAVVLDTGSTELLYQGSHSVVVDTSDVSRVVFEVASEMYTNVLVEGEAANGEWAPVAPSHEFWKSYVLSIPCMFDSMRLTITNVGRRPSQLFWTIGGYLV